MKTIFKVLALLVAFAFVGCVAQSGGGSTAVVTSNKPITITTPATLTNVSSPLKVCMATKGYTVEPAKNGVNPGKGHHHLLIDVPIPADLSKRIGKDSNHVHMGDGSKCKKLNKYFTELFSEGNIDIYICGDDHNKQLIKKTLKNFLR